MRVTFQVEQKPTAQIETPATITRRTYRVRQHGQTVHYGVEPGIHCSRYDRRLHATLAVASPDNERSRETEHPRFVRAATLKWGELLSESN